MRTKYAVAIGVAVLGLSSMVRADEIARSMPDGSTVRPVSAGPKLTVARAIDAILAAPDPSSVVEAYSRARALPSRGVVVAQAYVRRMTELDLPEMAEAQAKYVLESELTDPVSKAVIAAMRAKRGETESAIGGIASAVMFGSYEPFVRRTAGQILAWHDTRSGSMAEDVETSLQTMRRAVGETPECVAAYDKAKVAYLANRVAPFEAPRVAPTLVADSVQADFQDDEEDDVIIYTSALASCGASRYYSFWSPSLWSSYCSTLLRARDYCSFGAARCDTRSSYRWRYGDRNRYGYGYGYGGFGSCYSTWSTPLGMYSRSVRMGGCYSSSRSYCAPSRSGRGYDRGCR